mgnify:CR=1 FL=1
MGGALAVEEVGLAGRRPAAVEEGLDVIPPGVEVVLVELAEGGDDALPRAALGADGLAEGPVLVELAIDASAVFAQEHASCFSPGGKPARGVFSTTSGPSRKPPRLTGDCLGNPRPPTGDPAPRFFQLRSLF